MAKAQRKKKQKEFDMHPKLLMDVIQRQAGTLGKAVMEGVMNSVDAGSTYCDICVDKEMIIIEDDGAGFPDEATVDKYFNTFGQPHEESEGKVYGNFRMGRGQMFAFGHNLWESGTQEFDVDIKTRGGKWDYWYDCENEWHGCRITIFLYNPLLPSDQAYLGRQLQELVKWVDIPVTLNDEEISKDPSEGKWDYESDSCYVRLKTTGDLHVYNLGVHVKSFPGHQYGRGGEVVSKQQLKLNFARNDVMVNECPVWKEVKKFVAEQAGTEIKKKPSLNENERQLIANQIIGREISAKAAFGMRVYTDVLGRHRSLDQLVGSTYDYPCFSVAPANHRLGDKIHQYRLAFVFSQVTLDRFNLESAEELRKLLAAQCLEASPHRETFSRWKYKPLSELTVDLTETYQLVDKKEWTPTEQLVMSIASGDHYRLLYWLREVTGGMQKFRKLVLGESEAADGWTDGDSYIAISRQFIRQMKLDKLSSYIRLGQLLLHEYCHDNGDAETHTHSPEFYAIYHDSDRGVATWAELAIRALPKTAERLGRKLTKQQLKGQDNLVKVDEEMKQLAAKLS